MYAVVQLGHAVFGVGETQADAIRDAGAVLREFGSEDWKIVSLRAAVDGDLVVVPCTERFADEFREHGGAFTFDVRDGEARLPDEDEG